LNVDRAVRHAARRALVWPRVCRALVLPAPRVCRAIALAVVLRLLVMIKIPGHPRLLDDPKGPEAVIFGVQAAARPAAAPIRGRAAPRPRVPRLVCPAPHRPFPRAWWS